MVSRTDESLIKAGLLGEHYCAYDLYREKIKMLHVKQRPERGEFPWHKRPSSTAAAVHPESSSGSAIRMQATYGAAG